MRGNPKINKSNQEKPRFLVAPLDWGLGHATRCIPLIKFLITLDYEVIIAASGSSLSLLQQEFPQLQAIKLPGYRVKYGKNRMLTMMRIFLQIPKILISINREKAWLSRFQALERLDVVISDNRYGLYHPGIYCVFMTHQLSIQVPFGNFWERFTAKLHNRFIERFDKCWVPDMKDDPNLGGRLSHTQKPPRIPMTYIGPLSRFERLPTGSGTSFILILLSGPEPMRSILEKKLMADLQGYNGKAILLRGLPGESQDLSTTPGIRIFNHLPAAALNQLICDSEYVISRAGYSTVMDLVKLGKRSILIPTPGQTEQEYLASHLTQQKLALCISQDDFSLVKALEEARRFSYQELRQPDFLQYQQELGQIKRESSEKVEKGI